MIDIILKVLDAYDDHQRLMLEKFGGFSRGNEHPVSSIEDQASSIETAHPVQLTQARSFVKMVYGKTYPQIIGS